jgi:hypothetical protein
MAQHDGQPTNHEEAAGTQTSEEEEEGVIGGTSVPSCSVGPVMVPSLSAGQMMPTVPPLLCWNNIFGDILFAVGICVVNGLGYFAIDILLVGEGGSVHLRRPPNPKHICKTVLTPPVRRHGFSSRNVCTASIVFGGKLGG